MCSGSQEYESKNKSTQLFEKIQAYVPIMVIYHLPSSRKKDSHNSKGETDNSINEIGMVIMS